ncbi:MAG: thioredoxin family protein [Pseudomonadota bacterium]
MKRRTFLAATASFALLPIATKAATFVDYTPGAIQAALDAGKTVFVDYSATWCGTCRRQERVINALRAKDPTYDGAMMFVKVDWDTYKNHEVTQSRGIPRRSTLLVLRGEDELGRIVAGTSESQIKALMDKAL